MVTASAFQAEDVGSIPTFRSNPVGPCRLGNEIVNLDASGSSPETGANFAEAQWVASRSPKLRCESSILSFGAILREPGGPGARLQNEIAAFDSPAQVHFVVFVV